ncbi:hypothetical protein [Paludibacterium yongneupense]|uniref:hypothetical protein n=1 Tax=Paludibacterium yongneupense TaxID=400061 RepID=UPI00040EE838|nr:hypothetical protein [Paludibacterium yongneupense]
MTPPPSQPLTERKAQLLAQGQGYRQELLLAQESIKGVFQEGRALQRISACALSWGGAMLKLGTEEHKSASRMALGVEIGVLLLRKNWLPAALVAVQWLLADGVSPQRAPPPDDGATPL